MEELLQEIIKEPILLVVFIPLGVLFYFTAESRK